MKLLVDTHALLWWWSGDSRLSRAAAALLNDETNQVLVSVATAWEIATKQRIGRMPEFQRAAADLPLQIAEDDFLLLPIMVDHAIRGGSYDIPHGDPFDRLLAAQAELEDVPLLTRDPAFAAFPCEIIW